MQIINGLQTGGAEKLVMDLHLGYRNHGHTSKVISLTGGVAGWSEDGIYSLGVSTPYDPRVVKRLHAAARETGIFSADLIHAHLFPAQFHVALLREIFRPDCPFITTEHSTLNRRRNTLSGKMIDRWHYSGYDRIICVSRGAEEALCRWIPELADRTCVIYNGIDLKRFAVSRVFRSEPPFTVVSVGSLRDKKNYTAALRAFSILRNRIHFDVKYRIGGEGVLEDSLRNEAGILDLGSSIEFLGHVDDVAELLQDSDVFFMPSSSEGFGLAAVEAMASGLPVVASDIPGIGEIIGRNEGCGLLINPDSPEQMADALQNLLENRENAFRMGSDGLKRSAMFSIENTVIKHLSLYRSILEKGAE